MTAIPYQSSKQNMTVVWLGLLVILAVAYAAIAPAVKVQSHADIKHGQDAVMVRQCLENNGSYAVFEKPDGRIIRLCELDNGKFGLQVLQPDNRGVLHEITAFVKNKMTRIEQVLEYLHNCGATQIWP